MNTHVNTHLSWMTLNARPSRVHGLGIRSYCIFCPACCHFFFSDTHGKYVELLSPIVPVINVFPFLSKSILTAYSVTIKMDAGDTLFCRCNVSRGLWGGSIGDRGFSSWFQCALLGGPLQRTQLLQSLIRQHTWFLHCWLLTALSDQKRTLLLMGNFP